MRVLATGHKGYIGSVMVPILQEGGFEVLRLDNDLFEDAFSAIDQSVEMSQIFRT